MEDDTGEPLTCPTCGKVIERISYAVNFVFVDGVRYRTSATWELQHESAAGDILVCQLYDGEQTVGMETPSGVLWEWDPGDRVGQLRDLQSGRVVLQWREPEQERSRS